MARRRRVKERQLYIYVRVDGVFELHGPFEIERTTPLGVQIRTREILNANKEKRWKYVCSELM